MLRRILLPSLLGATLATAVPQSFPWQGALRDEAGKPLVSKKVSLRFEIKQADSVAYRETHTVTTGANGMVHASIGRGTPSKGSFGDVAWSLGTQTLAVAFDPSAGESFQTLGESPLQSVPFALVAGTSESGGTKGREVVSASIEGRSLVLRYSDGTSQNAGLVRDTLPPGILERVADTLRLKTADAKQGQVIRMVGGQWVADSVRMAAVTLATGGNLPISLRNPYLGVNHIIATQGIFPSRSGADPYIAEITLFAGDFAPRGYLFCDGTILSIAQNQALFALLGTNFGGDGRTTFAIPDLRGRVAVQPGQGPGLTPVLLGQTGGAEKFSITGAYMPAHVHDIPKE